MAIGMWREALRRDLTLLPTLLPTPQDFRAEEPGVVLPEAKMDVRPARKGSGATGAGFR